MTTAKVPCERRKIQSQWVNTAYEILTISSKHPNVNKRNKASTSTGSKHPLSPWRVMCIYSRTIKSDPSCYQISTLYAMSHKHMKESTAETTRKSRSLMKMTGIQQHASFSRAKSSFVDVLASVAGLHRRL